MVLHWSLILKLIFNENGHFVGAQLGVVDSALGYDDSGTGKGE